MHIKLVILSLLVCSSLLAQKSPEPGPDGNFPGPGVDKSGNFVNDPTRNVEALVAAEARRQDDLRIAEARFNAAQIASVNNILSQEREHQKELNIKEAGRLDSIRQVDRDDVSKTAAAANIAITTLAKQTADLSTTLAKQVQDTAIATEARQAAFSTEVYKRLQSLELSSSERTGKQQISDPQVANLIEEMRGLARANAQGTGKTEGVTSVFTTGNMLLLLLLAGGGFLIAAMNRRNQAGTKI